MCTQMKFLTSLETMAPQHKKKHMLQKMFPTTITLPKSS